MSIKLRIRELRKAQGMTLEDLEARSGVSLSQISRIERDDRGWTNDSLEKIAQALGVKPIELFDATDASAIDGDEVGDVSEQDTNGSSLGERLRKRREELGLTMQQVADAVGITRQSLSYWESGVTATPRSKYASALARVLDMRLEDLNPYLAPDDEEVSEKPDRHGASFRFTMKFQSGSKVWVTTLPNGTVEVQVEQKAPPNT